jgi:4-hydroxy-tetrahydrodipicolinate synthase
MDISFIRGVIPPIVTPVDADDHLDEPALARVIEYVIGGGVHGILVLGSTGEFFGLPDARVQERVLKVSLENIAGRVPAYFGIGAITTKECVSLAKMAAACGAQAITILPPMFVTPNDDELLAHFKAVAEATPLPVLIYNNPDRMNVNISANLIEKLAGVKGIVGVKDSSGDLTLTAEYIRRTRGSGFKVMAGRDVMILGTLSYGGAGCVASTANVAPRIVVEIYEKFMAGDLAGAREAQFRLAPLRLAFGLASFPSVIKDALNLLGLRVGNVIRPNTGCNEANLEKLRKILDEMGLPAAK